MPTIKPLSYLTQKCVVQFMDVNVRFHLIQKCALLRNVEKIPPLKIKTLQLEPCAVQVNGTMYKLESADSASVNMLTIRSSRRNKVEVFDHSTNRCINVALKYLMEKLFGGRTSSIQVRTLKIDGRDVSACCQFSSNLKLVIQKLKISNNTTEVFNELGPILDASSFPLKLLQIPGLTESNHNHQFITTAQSLVLSEYPSSGFINQFVHRRIHFRKQSYNYSDIVIILSTWQLHEREVGTYYSFAMKYTEQAKLFLKIANIQPGARLVMPEEQLRGRSREQVIIPVNNNAEIQIYYSNTRGSPTKFHMRIQPKTNQIPL